MLTISCQLSTTAQEATNHLQAQQQQQQGQQHWAEHSVRHQQQMAALQQQQQQHMEAALPANIVAEKARQAAQQKSHEFTTRLVVANCCRGNQVSGQG
jgi:hypothetical protein